MTADEFSRLWQEHWAAVGRDEAAVHAIYRDDAVLEFPQSGERFDGRATFQAWRERYPAQVEIELTRVTGEGSVWIAEGLIRYDGKPPLHNVNIVEFHGEKVARETIYFAEPFEAPEWRRPYASQPL